MAAVEHHVAGHRCRHPHRSPDDTGAHAQRRRAVDGEAPHLQVHGADRLAGARARAGSAGGGRQSPREERRSAVSHRPGSCTSWRSTASRHSSPRLRPRSASWSNRRKAPTPRPPRRARRSCRRHRRSPRSTRGSSLRESASIRTASWSVPAPATASTSSRRKRRSPKPRGSSRRRKASSRRRALARRRRSHPRSRWGNASVRRWTASSRRWRRSGRNSRTRNGASTRQSPVRRATATSSTCNCGPAASSPGFRSIL